MQSKVTMWNNIICILIREHSNHAFMVIRTHLSYIEKKKLVAPINLYELLLWNLSSSLCLAKLKKHTFLLRKVMR